MSELEETMYEFAEKNVCASCPTKEGCPWDRAKMMGKAVSGNYMKTLSNEVFIQTETLDIDPDSVKVGDKVKVIVIQEEE